MKYPIMIKKANYPSFVRLLLFALVLGISLNVYAQVPDRPNPPRLVNDMAGIFPSEQAKMMEDSLEAFARKTSNQIAVVTITDLNGQDKAQLAYEIGEKWGVGNKKFNNGIVILIKPKTSTNGEVFIATGYGLEGALPDAATKMIVENQMIPRFKKNDYIGGVNDALSVIKPIAAGEISFEDYKNKEDHDSMIAGLVIFFILFGGLGLLFFFGNHGSNTTIGGNNNHRGGGGIFFGGGGGGFGGGSGGSSGFGGFGGGSFGGGGAGGSW